MKTIWLASLERVETRYTWEWGTYIPAEICRQAQIRGLTAVYMESPSYEELTECWPKVDVAVVDVLGDLPEQTASTGAFLNFASTNIWKSSQLEKIATAFHKGLVRAGDVFYFTDAWNPSILQVKYMSDLLDIPVTICGQWHAGAHDPWDFLGRKIKDKEWVFELERALFHALDHNFFTTYAYIDLFYTSLDTYTRGKDHVVRTGYPNGYLLESLPKYSQSPSERQDLILFPHRIAPEKQIDIFKDLEKALPQYKWVVCQEQNLTKDEYHKLLGGSKLVFSAALQETYGIAQTEAPIAGAMPLSPDRLSYSEMYHQAFLYPSEWTTDFEAYLIHKEELVSRIVLMMENYDTDLMQKQIKETVKFLKSNDYIGGTGIWNSLLEQ